MKALDSESGNDMELASEISMEDEQLVPVEQPIDEAEVVGLADRQREQLLLLCNEKDELPPLSNARVHRAKCRKEQWMSVRLLVRKQSHCAK